MSLEPNARHELRLEAGTTQERTLEAVSSMPLLGVNLHGGWTEAQDVILPRLNCTAPAEITLARP